MAKSKDQTQPRIEQMPPPEAPSVHSTREEGLTRPGITPRSGGVRTGPIPQRPEEERAIGGDNVSSVLPQAVEEEGESVSDASVDESDSSRSESYESWTMEELRPHAKDLGIEGVWSLSKDELIKEIKKKERAS